MENPVSIPLFGFVRCTVSVIAEQFKRMFCFNDLSSVFVRCTFYEEKSHVGNPEFQ